MKIKQWGIKVNNKWIEGSNRKPAIYKKYSEAIKDVRDFNSMAKRGDTPYAVHEYT